LFAGLEPGRHSHQRIIEVIDEPRAAKRDNTSQHDVRQSSHEHAKQMCEGAQYRCAGVEELPAYLEKRPDHSRQDQDQQNLLSQRPLLPRHGRELADLVHRPHPDELDEAEDGRNPIMQEFQKLIEHLFHG
jgi:hypothetical protein